MAIALLNTGCGGGADTVENPAPTDPNVGTPPPPPPAPPPPTNNAPTISGQPTGSIEAGVQYVFAPTASDADGDDLVFSVSNLPPWAEFDEQTGTLSGYPDIEDFGEHGAIVISVSDSQSTVSLDAFSIRVVLPPPTWQSRDIGDVAAKGTFTQNGNQLTVEGSGQDIWGTRDEFHFVYQALEGDGEIVAQVSRLDNTNPRAKAGVMIRDTLDDNSMFADVIVTTEHGADMHYRREKPTWAKPFNSYDEATAAPAWVRLTRIGDRFTGYKSADGISWEKEDETTIPMTSTVYIGLAVTSRDDGALTTAVFENVALSEPQPPPPDTTPPTVPQDLKATPASPSRIRLRWSGSTDSETGVAGYRVYRDGTLIGETPDTRLTATGLQPNTSYSFAVSAFDHASPPNESAPSASAQASTESESAVMVPDVTGIPVADAEAAIESAGLTVGDIRNRRSETVPKRSVIEQTPAAGTDVQEGDAVDLVVSSGPPVTEEADSTPPSVPASVRVSATTSSSITVRWNASTDEQSGIGGYRVFADDDFIGSTSNLRFTVRDLDPATEYEISVSAYDDSENENESDRSTPILATTDGEEGSSVRLRWRAPTQNTDGSALVDLAGFVIYFGRQSGRYEESLEVNSPTKTSAVFDDLSSGTWYFSAIAITDTGAESELSNELEVSID